VIGLSLGFTLEKIEVSADLARALWKLGPESEDTGEPATSGVSRLALVDAARTDESTLDRLIQGIRAAAGTSERRVLDYLTMSMAGRVAQARTIPEQDGGFAPLLVRRRAPLGELREHWGRPSRWRTSQSAT